MEVGATPPPLIPKQEIYMSTLIASLNVESLALESADLQTVAAFIDACAVEIKARCQANAMVISICDDLIAVAATLDNQFS